MTSSTPRPLEPVPADSIESEHATRQQLATGLVKIGLATRHHAWAGGETLGLSPTQGQVLVLLHQRGARGMRLGDVAHQLAVSQATASVAVRTLVEKGLISRATPREDRRAVNLTLTERGEEAAQVAATWTDFLLEAVNELAAREQGAFQRGLVKMIRRMQERGQIPVSQMCVTCVFFRPHVHDDPETPHHCDYIEAPFGDRQLRLACRDHIPASSDQAEASWIRFVAAD
jgi:DNA-binding MarR family transcriptional regulator